MKLKQWIILNDLKASPLPIHRQFILFADGSRTSVAKIGMPVPDIGLSLCIYRYELCVFKYIGCVTHVRFTTIILSFLALSREWQKKIDRLEIEVAPACKILIP